MATVTQACSWKATHASSSRSSKATQGPFYQLPQCFVCQKGLSKDECQLMSTSSIQYLIAYIQFCKLPDCRVVELDQETQIPKTTFRFPLRDDPLHQENQKKFKRLSSLDLP